MEKGVSITLKVSDSCLIVEDILFKDGVPGVEIIMGGRDGESMVLTIEEFEQVLEELTAFHVHLIEKKKNKKGK